MDMPEILTQRFGSDAKWSDVFEILGPEFRPDVRAHQSVGDPILRPWNWDWTKLLGEQL
jgi:hypothetical protein